MKTHNTIFDTEWNRFLSENGFSNTIEAINNTDELSGFIGQPETIARFRSGKRALSDTHIGIFSKLFKVRPEYLSGKDDFRTDEDIALYKKKEETILKGVYTVFYNLGYVDLYTDITDYNLTFPENTKAFIEFIKDDLRKENYNLLIDVQNDRYVSLCRDDELQFINDILSFIQYKIGQLFDSYSNVIPRCITENGKYLCSPHNEIELIDGSILNVDFRYIPTNILLNNSGEIDVIPEVTVSKQKED